MIQLSRMPFLSLCFMNAMGSLRMQTVTGDVGDWMVECWESWGLGVACDVWWHELTTREGRPRGPGNSVSSESDVKPLSALPGWWCLPPGIYRCQHPRETILNNLSSSLQSGEMSPVHLEIADWQLPFLGLSRSNPSHSYNYLNSKQGLSLLTHIFIISTLTRVL